MGRKETEIKITAMQIQNLDAPLGIQAKRPVMSYRIERMGVPGQEGQKKNIYQSKYRILAATGEDLLDKEYGDLWDSGIVESREAFGIVYQGEKLKSREIIYWKVKVWDQDGNDLGWSGNASWEMGLFEDDWQGQWIGQGEDYAGSKEAAPLFVCDFNAELADMKHARLYISGLGVFQASLNGRRIEETFFDPGECDATETVYYVTYNVSSMLKEGANVLGVVVGNGQYTNFQIDPVMTNPDGTLHPLHRYQKNDGGFVKPGISGNKKLIAQMEITYRDGRRVEAVLSGTDWKWKNGPVVFQNWYGGEDYDATMETKDWDKQDGSRDGWETAVIMDAPTGKLTAREFPPIQIVEKIPAQSVKKLKNGNWLVDMGRNGAGFPEINIDTTADMRGIWIKMYPAELLREDGEGVDQASCTQSWNERYQCAIIDSYRIRGTGKEIWHPSFCYQGFQYVEVEGWRKELYKENFSYCILRTANEKAGYFKSSDESLNRVNDMVEHSMESNMFSTFTDCPQIEKLGWIETSHLMVSFTGRNL